jgi:hypothetical protein
MTAADDRGCTRCGVRGAWVRYSLRARANVCQPSCAVAAADLELEAAKARLEQQKTLLWESIGLAAQSLSQSRAARGAGQR